MRDANRVLAIPIDTGSESPALTSALSPSAQSMAEPRSPHGGSPMSSASSAEGLVHPLP